MGDTLKVGIVGSRRRNTQDDKKILKEALLKLLEKTQKKNKLVELVSGGCPKGADKFAEELAEELDLKITIHYPDKKKMRFQAYSEYARICYERNTLIAQDSDILIAVVHKDRKGGTEDTVKKAERFGKKVVLLKCLK